MNAGEINWEVVRTVALGLGASRFAVYKWRQRKMVPYRWRRLLVFGSGGRVRWDHFDDMDKARQAP
jgi:hypothetical protein